jgi:hypothetical protein
LGCGRAYCLDILVGPSARQQNLECCPLHNIVAISERRRQRIDNRILPAGKPLQRKTHGDLGVVQKTYHEGRDPWGLDCGKSSKLLVKLLNL